MQQVVDATAIALTGLRAADLAAGENLRVGTVVQRAVVEVLSNLLRSIFQHLVEGNRQHRCDDREHDRRIEVDVRRLELAGLIVSSPLARVEEPTGGLGAQTVRLVVYVLAVAVIGVQQRCDDAVGEQEVQQLAKGDGPLQLTAALVGLAGVGEQTHPGVLEQHLVPEAQV